MSTGETMSEIRTAFDRDWSWPAGDHFGWDHPLQGWPAIEELLVRHCQNWQVVVQAGGCCGMYPARLARLFATVYTFELDPVNFRYLVRRHCLSLKFTSY